MRTLIIVNDYNFPLTDMFGLREKNYHLSLFSFRMQKSILFAVLALTLAVEVLGEREGRKNRGQRQRGMHNSALAHCKSHS